MSLPIPNSGARAKPPTDSQTASASPYREPFRRTRGRKSKTWAEVRALIALCGRSIEGDVLLESNPDLCWNWTGFSDEKGPRIYFAGQNRLVRKLAYYVEHGEMPKAVTSTCDNAQCINPAHLREGPRSKGGRPSKLTPEILSRVKAGVERGDSVASWHRVLSKGAGGDFVTVQTLRAALKKKPL